MLTSTMSSSGNSKTTLARWRMARGFTQERVATLVSAILGRTVHQQNIHHWETGVIPGADAAEAIRKVTGGAVTGDSFGRQKCPRA